LSANGRESGNFQSSNHNFQRMFQITMLRTGKLNDGNLNFHWKIENFFTKRRRSLAAPETNLKKKLL
jgi:hypothetical protein